MGNDRMDVVSAADGTELAVRRWSGDGGETFVLVHGLASNMETWSEVAAELHHRGHGVVAYDQRGHGRSDQAGSGYDLDTALDDLDAVLASCELTAPILAGQSWGANVVLAHAARANCTAAAALLVDGGIVDLADVFASWEECAALLRPPVLGLGLDAVAARIRAAHPDWSERAVAATVANLAAGPDGTARNRLPLDAHLQLLRAMWDHPPSAHHGAVTVPARLLLAATDDAAWTAAKRAAAEGALAALARGSVIWIDGDHDLHVQQPAIVAAHLLDRSWR